MPDPNEWILNLQLFLNSRLKTPAFTAAEQKSPGCTVPSMLSNTQYLLDGIVWSFNDNPHGVSSGWLTIQNHLKSVSDRFGDLKMQLLEQGKSNASKEAHAPSRKFYYEACACIQDIYLAFCAIDALLKNVRNVDGLHESIEEEIPHLVTEYFPIWKYYGNNCLDGASDEFRHLFLDLLRSWLSMGCFSEYTKRKLEEYARCKLKTTRAELDDGADPQKKVTAVRKGIHILTGSNSSRPKSANKSAFAMKQMLRNFSTTIYPSIRHETWKLRCGHCGAFFKSVEAKDVHYRYHFYNRSFTNDDKLVRLQYPKAEDFITHSADCGLTGKFIRTTDSLVEALKSSEKVILKVRKAKE